MIRPILRGAAAQIVCKTVRSFDEELRALITDLKHTMLVHEGAGLAAPQIGSNLRVFVYEINENEIASMCNPQIVERHDWVKHPREGCLSMPGFAAMTQRAESIKVKAQSPTGHGYTVKLSGKLAWVVQHEIDHLDGRTIYP